MLADLFNLSLALQISIAGGYLAYLIAYSGIRQHHSASDIIFRSFGFGIIASSIMTYGYNSTFLTPLVAFFSTIAAGVLWRMLLMHWWQNIARWAKISWSNDIPTAWLSITATRTDFSPSQISVELMDGRILFCEDTRLFGDAHEGPVTFGLNGDVALYVTAECRADGSWIEKEDVRHLYEGDLITYIPSAQIKRVEVRYLSEKAAKEAVRRAVAEEAEEP